MVEKFGRTLILLLFILIFILGAQMALKVGEPYIRKASASLADAISGAVGTN